MDSPISIALDLKMFRESTDLKERSFVDIVEAISELRKKIYSIEKRLSSPDIPHLLDLVRDLAKDMSELKNLIQSKYYPEKIEDVI
ncbi:MAG: hypothetical protein L6N94_03160 [Candidatus Methylarchaceae archaeon HK01M]|nr:hypothetical protein [Candidatus Methylarchaceae archaeon HK01M]